VYLKGQLWSVLVPIVIVAGLCGLFIRDCVILSAAEAQRTPREIEAEEIAIALRRKLQLPYESPDQTHPYVAHCRNARGGCEARTLRFARLFVDLAGDHQIDPYLIAAIAMRETALNPRVVGDAGERGVMQVHPGRREAARARRVCARNRQSANVCEAAYVVAGVEILAGVLTRCPRVEDAIGAYHSGRCGGGGDAYIRAVLELRAELGGDL
jgi:hypothetical protein